MLALNSRIETGVPELRPETLIGRRARKQEQGKNPESPSPERFGSKVLVTENLSGFPMCDGVRAEAPEELERSWARLFGFPFDRRRFFGVVEECGIFPAILGGGWRCCGVWSRRRQYASASTEDGDVSSPTPELSPDVVPAVWRHGQPPCSPVEYN
ncbi:hypothetical protein NL676_017914 [Syzygium grande]|nr:hypothetical protein NL676_017914 [Syzygium grande]